jgi:hypothetical protein
MNFAERYPHLTIALVALAIGAVAIGITVANLHAQGFKTIFG